LAYGLSIVYAPRETALSGYRSQSDRTRENVKNTAFSESGPTAHPGGPIIVRCITIGL
jgi:hypothetical protein